MGWKCSLVFGVREPRAPGDAPLAAPRHDPQAAIALAAECQLGVLTPVNETNLSYGIYPHERGEVVISASADGTFACIADRHELRTAGSIALDHATDPRFQAMLRRYPAGSVLACELQSVTDYWAFALYERGRFLRCAAGCADEGILVSEGVPLPEESASPIPDLNESDISFDGEGLVFTIAARMFGQPFDQVPLEKWTATTFRRAKPWWKFW